MLLNKDYYFRLMDEFSALRTEFRQKFEYISDKFNREHHLDVKDDLPALEVLFKKMMAKYAQILAFCRHAQTSAIAFELKFNGD